MSVELVLEALREAFPAEDLAPRVVPLDDAFVTLSPGCIHPAVELLIERFELYHLSTITGEDTGDRIALLYHFWDGGGVTLCTSLAREEPRIATLTDLIPGAAFYEREVGEMVGVVFEGSPDLLPLLLPDDWKDGPPLCRQEEA